MPDQIDHGGDDNGGRHRHHDPDRDRYPICHGLLLRVASDSVEQYRPGGDVSGRRRHDGVVRMHSDEVHVDEWTVRQLLDEQFPQWRARPVVKVQTMGTVNTIFRIGSDLAARFPLVAQDPDQARLRLIAEANAAREFAAASTVPTTEPVALGEPGEGYPLPWSVQTWLPGHDATVDDPAASIEFASDLAALIASLRCVDTRGRHFDGDGRGGRLQDHDEWLEVCFRECE